MKRVPPGGLSSTAGFAATALASSDSFELDGHGLDTNDRVQVRAIEGGSLPAPLAEGVTYFAVRLTNASFALAATEGGAPIDLTSDGVEIALSREPDFDYWINEYSRWADNFFPAHAVPFSAGQVPTIVTGSVADCVAKRMFNVGGQGSETLDQVEIAAKAKIERHAAGLPIRGQATPRPTNLAITSTLSNALDPRGWGSGRLP